MVSVAVAVDVDVDIGVGVGVGVDIDIGIDFAVAIGAWRLSVCLSVGGGIPPKAAEEVSGFSDRPWTCVLEYHTVRPWDFFDKPLSYILMYSRVSLRTEPNEGNK